MAAHCETLSLGKSLFCPFELPPLYPALRVGGRLQHFSHFWETLPGCTPFILSMVRGYSPPFVSPPTLSLPEANFSTPSKGASNVFVDDEVQALLAKGAIEEVPLVPLPPSYISNVFLVPKKDGGMRPILNLKKLNAAHLDTPHFKQDTLEDVRHALRPGDWAASIDLKDAYFHVPIARHSRKFLRFGWKGILYQFCVLPFGLSPAPRVFTSLTRLLKAILGAKGIRTIFYLDDILILGSTYYICLQNTREALQLLIKAGFIIHWVKSRLEPATSFTFLGLRWDTVAASLSLPQEKILQLQSQASFLIKEQIPTCRQVMVLSGLIAAFFRAVPLLRLRGRLIQVSKNFVYFSEADLQKKVSLLPQAFQDLEWICRLTPPQCSAPLWPLTPEDCELEIHTDASDDGFGIWFQGQLHQGTWDSQMSMEHINVKELIALSVALDTSLQSQRDKSILWRIDNTTALAYVKKEGGTCSFPLLQAAEEILTKAHKRGLRFLPVYIPSEENILADAASRFLDIPDWHLRPEVFQAIVKRWGLPVIDLFATSASRQLPRFFSWNVDDRPEAIDALCQRWDFSLAYLFPPIPLIKKVIKKLETSRGTFILISPLWTARTWLASLLALDVEEVRRLPFSSSLVKDLKTGLPPPILRNLHLVAWKISGGVKGSTRAKTTISLQEPAVSSRMGGDPPQTSAMTPAGGSSSSFFLPPFLSIEQV